MKIVTRAQFMEYPAETVFSNYTPCYFGHLEIKGDSIIHDGRPIDWLYQPISDAVESKDSRELFEKLIASAKSGESLSLDFECQSRDGMFDDRQLYAVWEPRDVAALMLRLHRCVPDRGLVDKALAHISSAMENGHPQDCALLERWECEALLAALPDYSSSGKGSQRNANALLVE
jgi:hypothetical protein